MSLREDYIHYLLELDRLCPIDTFNEDILNKHIRYYIGNFSKTNAYHVIHNLTERSQIQLTRELLDRLVDDLANEIGEIRPIELQVVGAQLQAQNIRTLAEYEKHGPKERLVQQFLEEVIADCGPKNEQAARLLLYFLTEETGIRPVKTLAELGSELVASGLNVQQLESILEILEKSGLLFKLPELTTNRYQLVHDYLVTFIRQQPQIQQELKDLQKKYQKLVQEKELVDQLAVAKEKEKKNLQFTRNLSSVGLLIFVCLSVLAWYQTQDTKKAKQKATREAENAETAAKIAEIARDRSQIAEIEATNAASKALLLSNNQLEALVASVKAGLKVPALETPSAELKAAELKAETVNRLYQTLHQISEINRLQAHRDSVVSISFSPNGDFLVSGSIDNTVKIWNPQGDVKKTIFTHDRPITRVAVSPDGQIIASASIDKTVKLWNRDGSNVADLQGHTEGVTGVSFSLNGDLVATSSQDKTIKLWKLDGTLVRTIEGHTEAVTSVSFSRTSQTIASTSADRTIKLWNYDGKLLKTFTGHSEAVTGVSFSADGKWIATASWDKTVKLWNTDSGTLFKTLIGHRDRVLGVSFSPDGKIMASAAADNTVILWKTDGTKIRELRGHQQAVRSVSFSPDGKTLASASSDNTIKLWKTFVSGELPAIKYHDQPVLAVSYSPDGQIIASASEDRTIGLSSPNGTKIDRLTGHEGAVWDLSFSPNGDILASAGGDRTVRLWKIAGKPGQKILGKHEARVLAVSFSPDGETIASGSEDGVMQLWKQIPPQPTVKKGALLITGMMKAPQRWRILGEKDNFKSPQQLKIYSSVPPLLRGGRGGLNIYSFGLPLTKGSQCGLGETPSRAPGVDGRGIRGFRGRYRNETNKFILQFSNAKKGGAREAKSEKGDRLQNPTWEKNSQKLATIQAHKSAINRISFSPKGDLIATASSDTKVKIWREDGTLQTTLDDHQGEVWSVTFSPNGDRIATASSDNTVKLWNTNGDRLNTLSGHLGSVYWVSFSADGQLIATASKDKTVKVWDAKGNLLTTLEGHTAAVLSLSFSPDGKTIASASQDNRVILWNLAFDQLVLNGCHWLQDYLATNPHMKRDRDICHGFES